MQILNLLIGREYERILSAPFGIQKKIIYTHIVRRHTVLFNCSK